jgi:hypothetical protein
LDLVSPEGTAWYAVWGSTRRKKKPKKVRKKVPAASSLRKALVFPGNITLPVTEKKNALSPKAAKGKAVAVPRWWGQFSADVLTAAAKAMQPPSPVRNEKTHSIPTDPTPVS